MRQHFADFFPAAFQLCSESSWVRAGASPRQKGTLGGAAVRILHQHAAKRWFRCGESSMTY